jgi:acetate kinase
VKKLASGTHAFDLRDAEFVLALNRRDAVVRYALFSCRRHEEELLHRGKVRGADDRLVLRNILSELADAGAPAPTAVGHRLLYGLARGANGQLLLDDATFAALAARVSLAPLQFGLELSLVQTARAELPLLPHVASFDTAFHASIPAVASTYALPEELRELGVRRLGFHGLAYEHIVDIVGGDILGRALLFYLGGTSSIAAVRYGSCVDTTMGLTPLGGLVMGASPGDLDPGVVLYLLRSGHDARSLERIFSERAGLAGLTDEDELASLIPRRGRDPSAALAFEIFVQSARKWAGALTTVLGGLDTIVFTGNDSENAVVRDEICGGLGHLGVVLDPSRNKGKAVAAGLGSVISADRSRVVVRMIAHDEERMIARHTRTALSSRRLSARRHHG